MNTKRECPYTHDADKALLITRAPDPRGVLSTFHEPGCYKSASNHFLSLSITITGICRTFQEIKPSGPTCCGKEFHRLMI